MGRLAGIAWIILASVAFSIMGVATKLAVPVEGTLPVVFWRSVIVFVVAFALARAQKVSLRPKRWGLLMWRSITGLVAMILFFWSLGQIPLGTATTLLYTSPLFTVLMAGAMLGERRQRRTFPLALLAFIGVGLVLGPDASTLGWGALAALAAGFLAALAYVAVRQLRASDPPARIVAFFSVVAALACAPATRAAPLPDSFERWAWLAAVGLCAAGGQLCMTWAYRVEQAHVVGPFSYATVVISWAIGLIAWDEPLTALGALGVALVVGSGALLSGSADAEHPREPEPTE